MNFRTMLKVGAFEWYANAILGLNHFNCQHNACAIDSFSKKSQLELQCWYLLKHEVFILTGGRLY